MSPYLRAAAQAGGSRVAAIGVAQEFAPVWTGYQRQSASPVPQFTFAKAQRRVTCYYFYVVDADFGAGFVKICSYFPYPVKVWVNGHEYAKAQAAQAGLGFTALSNGFATCTNPTALQAICDSLGPRQIQAFCDRWLTRLPVPLGGADEVAGYWWEFSMRQIEVSRTLVFDAPRHARGFFEALVADNPHRCAKPYEPSTHTSTATSLLLGYPQPRENLAQLSKPLQPRNARRAGSALAGLGDRLLERVDDPGTAPGEAELVHRLGEHFLLRTQPAVALDPPDEPDEDVVGVLGDRQAGVERRLGGHPGRGHDRRPDRGLDLKLRAGRDSILVRLQRAGDLGVAVVEPVGRPDPMEPPAQPFQMLLAQPVAIASGGRRVVRPAVGLDGEHELGRVVGMRRREVDAVAAHAVL